MNQNMVELVMIANRRKLTEADSNALVMKKHIVPSIFAQVVHSWVIVKAKENTCNEIRNKISHIIAMNLQLMADISAISVSNTVGSHHH